MAPHQAPVFVILGRTQNLGSEGQWNDYVQLSIIVPLHLKPQFGKNRALSSLKPVLRSTAHCARCPYGLISDRGAVFARALMRLAGKPTGGPPITR